MAAGRTPVAAAAVVLVAPVIAWAAVPTWLDPWIALALAAPVVGWAVDRRPPGPLGALAVAGPVAALGWSVYLLGAGSPSGPAAGGAPLAAAGVLGALVLLSRDVDHPAQRTLTAFVLGSAVAALGFGLGRGIGPDALSATTAVLVAGSPVALLLVPPRTRRVDTVVVPAELLTTGELEVRAVHLIGEADEDAVRRFAAALHSAALHSAAPHPAAPHPAAPHPAAPHPAAVPGATPSTGAPGDAAHAHADAARAEAAPAGVRSPDTEPSDGERPAIEPLPRATSAHARKALRARTAIRARAHEFIGSRRMGSPVGGEVPGRTPPSAAVLPGDGRCTLGRAVVAAAENPLPGVSDLDGHPDTGLRGVVSELHEDRIVAHAVLAGPPAWLAEHGVAAPDGTGPGALAVAWDGVARGWLEITEAARPGATAGIAALRRRGVEVIPAGTDGPPDRLRPAARTVVGNPARHGGEALWLPARDLVEVARAVRRQHRRVLLRRVCLVVAVAAAAAGAAAALVGLLNPVTAVAVPAGAAAFVVAGRVATTRSGLPPSKVWLRP